MKALLILVVLLSLTVSAQTITNYHVGGLYSITFSPESNWDRVEYFNFRVAVEVVTPEWKLFNLSAKGRFIYTTPSEKSFGQLWLIHRNELGEFSLGKQPRPIAVQKPNPTTCGAGFEPTARLVMPGAAVGFLYSNNMISKLNLQFGIYDKGDHQVEYNTGIYLQDYGVRVAGYLSKNTKGVAVSVVNGDISYTVFCSKDKYSTFLELEWNIFKPYLNWAYDSQVENTIASEFGVTKEFDSPLNILGLEGSLKWLLGVGYDTEKKELALYSFCHL